MSNTDSAAQYWRANLKLLGQLLVVWLIVSYGFGIWFVEWLNQVSIGGIKLGFFFAQQGAIYVFVALIFIYVRQMNKLDRQFGVDEE